MVQDLDYIPIFQLEEEQEQGVHQLALDPKLVF